MTTIYPLPGESWVEWASSLVAVLNSSETRATQTATGEQEPILDGEGRVVVNPGDGIYIYDAIGDLIIWPGNVAIDTDHLVDAAITTQKLADLSVDVDKLADLAVEASKLADSAVTSTKIANLAVGSAAIQAAAIGTAHIANLAVTSALIADAAIIEAKIQDLAVTNAKINDISANKITAGILTAALTYTAGMNISTGGYIRSGQPSYGVGTGYYMDYNAGSPRLSLGNSASQNELLWNGSSLVIRGAGIYTPALYTSIDGKRIEVNPGNDNELHFYGDRGDGTVEELATIGISTVGADTVVLDIGGANLQRQAAYIEANYPYAVWIQNPGANNTSLGVSNTNTSSVVNNRNSTIRCTGYQYTSDNASSPASTLLVWNQQSNNSNEAYAAWIINNYGYGVYTQCSNPLFSKSPLRLWSSTSLAIPTHQAQKGSFWVTNAGIPYINVDDGTTWHGLAPLVVAKIDGVSSPINIISGFNVSSVTYNGTGNYTLSFTNALPNANYIVVCNASTITTDASLVAAYAASRTTTNCVIDVERTDTGAQLNAYVDLIIFGV